MKKAETARETHFVGCYLSASLFKSYENFCKKHGYTKSEFLRELLRQAVKDEGHVKIENAVAKVKCKIVA